MSWDNTPPDALTVAAPSYNNTAPTGMTVAASSWNNERPTPMVATGQDASELLTTDFSAGAQSWVAEGSGASVAGNIDSIGGVNDCLRLTLGSAGGYADADGLGLNAGIGSVIRVRLRYFVPTTNTTFGNGAVDIVAKFGTAGTERIVAENVTEGATWKWIEFTLTAADSVDNLKIGVNDTVTAGDLLYLRDISIYQIT